MPKVKVSDPVVQRMVDDVSAALRGVDDKCFPRIEYIGSEKRGDACILFFVAKGNGFKVGVVCGTDGVMQKVMLVANNGKFQSNAHPINSPDDLRQFVDHTGNMVRKYRSKR